MSNMWQCVSEYLSDGKSASGLECNAKGFRLVGLFILYIFLKNLFMSLPGSKRSLERVAGRREKAEATAWEG